VNEAKDGEKIEGVMRVMRSISCRAL
jgi:hypothetical protein